MPSLLASTTIPHFLSSISNNPLWRTTNSSRPSQIGSGIVHISCEQKQTNPKERSPDQTALSLDRRNVLVGLGGLYGATTATKALSAPIKPPSESDLSKCKKAIDAETHEEVSCCPPYPSAKITHFVPPSSTNVPLRVRKPAHKYPAEELAKFEAAITKMKQLPDDDPWNYWQQATIHCTFCNGSFNQAGSENLFQVHDSWLFLPWHRCNLYFWEKILGKLIDDPTFAVPFWNWDTKDGMKLPEIYWKNKDSPLYDDTRNKSHYKTMVDYYEGVPYETPTHQNPDEVALGNYGKIYKDFTEGQHLPSLFMGKPYRAGDKPGSSSPGSCESVHGYMHSWAGPPEPPYYNMGNFHTAARDTLFFGLHANVDRMWDLYTKCRGNKPEFTDTDWLDSAFIFVDENRDVVKIKVKDCLRPELLGYAYSDEALPWKNIGRKFREFNRRTRMRSPGDSLQLVPVSEFGSTPRPLKEAIRALVPRPKTSRSRDEREAALEVLVIDDIVIPSGTPAKFDIYIAKPFEGRLVGPDYGYLAGHYILVPHVHIGPQSHMHDNERIKSDFQTGITTLLEDIDAEGSKNLVVTLVPRYGNITIGGIHIELLEIDDGED